MRRPIEALVKRVYHTEGNPIVRGGGRQKITIEETISKDLDLNGLSIDIVYDRMQWCHLIYVANPTL